MLALLVTFLALIIQLCRVYQLWLFLPGILMRIKVGPVRANEEVVWTAKQHRIGEENQLKRPNIVLILVDDLGFNDISFYGASRLNISTPNIGTM